MVRRLPWEQAADNGTLPPPSYTPARSRRPRPIIDSSDIELSPQKPSVTRNALSSVPSPTAEHSGHCRARSISAPLGPPEEVFMIDGFQNDDKYRMVEDEFLDIAKEYTQHLHAAEYLRLKAAARNKGAAAAGEITRPVIGSMPDATKRKLESIERAKEQAEAVAKLKKDKAKMEYESDAEAPEPWLGTALHGLMEKPNRTTFTITDVVDTASTSKAARGFKGNKIGRMEGYGLDSGDDTDQAPSRSPRHVKQEAEPESDDDGLDAPIITSWKQRLPVASSLPPLKKQINTELDLPPPPRRSLFAKTAAAISAPTPRLKTTSPPSEAPASIGKEDVALELPRTSADILARMAKRRELAKRKRERDEEETKKEELAAKKRKESVIPTFL